MALKKMSLKLPDNVPDLLPEIGKRMGYIPSGLASIYFDHPEKNVVIGIQIDSVRSHFRDNDKETFSFTGFVDNDTLWEGSKSNHLGAMPITGTYKLRAEEIEIEYDPEVDLRDPVE
ncbi:MAG TPA: hypothetical protein VLE93_01645 [Candidatus Saccharimonadales bacterium]|nr:hypothetical protein [Candidatus Saccharimonadales bacterium]